jgi:electron transfer flavoprotein alpha subunit
VKVFVLAVDAAVAASLVSGARAQAYIRTRLDERKGADAGEARPTPEAVTDLTEVALLALSEDVAQTPADTVYRLQLPADAMLEDAAQSLAVFLREQSPDVLFVQPTRQMRLLAGKIAALLGTTAIGDLLACNNDGSVQHLVYGGAAVRTEKATTATQIVFTPAGAPLEGALPEGALSGDALPAGAPLGPKGSGAPAIVQVEFIAPTRAPRLLASRSREKTTVDLTIAKRIVGVGRGIAVKEDLRMIEDLASCLEAEIGCTRPIAEEEKWLPREVYIGVSGALLSPEIYLGIGLSGQVQHTVGINRSKKILAVNKDKNAPIFKQADYGIVADLYKVVPLITKLLTR